MYQKDTDLDLTEFYDFTKFRSKFLIFSFMLKGFDETFLHLPFV